MKTAKTFTTIDQVREHLDGLGFFHMDLSLGRMETALARLGLTRPPFVVAQIVGTNGKGSTAAFLDSLSRAHGCRTGLYTSPHFLSPCERIRIDGVPLPEDQWPALATEVHAAQPELTYFEFLTVLAVLAFARRGVQLAVMEAGLGGAHDATTALAADLTCFAPVAMDHAAVLGPTLRNIAADKCGAIRPHVPVVSAPQFPAAADVLQRRADRLAAPLHVVAPLPGNMPLGLAGPHQRINAAVALHAWQALTPRLHLRPRADAVARGLARAFVPGRLQSVPATGGHPPLLLDGAHNAHGMAALLAHLRQAGLRPRAAIYSCLGDKDWHPALMLLKRALGAAPLFIPALHNERAADAAQVTAAANAVPPAGAILLPDVRAALEAARDLPGDAGAPVIISGSLYLLAEFYALYPQLLHAPAPDRN
ncbi:cyanophycin synthetase [uncultured Desulfovibrio sp.]|uniref:bifunctional folylpolyglutamate synthase/dihydrofolate synthase n=1 Tax=uncultured Desulfovibrio sp. TaxID=167968 RepID=UPI002614F9CE|nr:cyanophycin synthetase [uncultured Desulfovibrio sp.]